MSVAAYENPESGADIRCLYYDHCGVYFLFSYRYRSACEPGEAACRNPNLKNWACRFDSCILPVGVAQGVVVYS